MNNDARIRPAIVGSLRIQVRHARQVMDEINGTLDRLEAAPLTGWDVVDVPIVWTGFEDETGRFHRDNP